MDVHHPYDPVVSKAGVQNDLLNTVHSTDAGFGEFWEYFKTSRYKDNTIVIFTADHALFPTADYLDVRQEDVGYYDKIPLMIYSPFHDALMGSVNDIKGSQLDIAPTLYELLEVDSHNSFVGLSLLSDRKDYPYMFGKVNLISRVNSEAGVTWSNAEQTELIKYFRFLASRNRLFPPPGEFE
jgi:phosphoglycerol transferase MdoB-like AlkP superfamily enzyme